MPSRIQVRRRNALLYQLRTQLLPSGVRVNEASSALNREPVAVDEVAIEDYDPSYPARFESEAKAIRELLGRPELEIEHHGSTAVPGLPAKPVIDLMVCVSSLEEAQAHAEVLRRAGYDDNAAIYRKLMPDRIIMIRREEGRRRCHAHLILRDCPEFRRNILFRDYLRANPQAASEYAKLKRKSAQEFPNDREAYRKSKGEFINRIVSLAVGTGREDGEG